MFTKVIQQVRRGDAFVSVISYRMFGILIYKKTLVHPKANEGELYYNF